MVIFNFCLTFFLLPLTTLTTIAFAAIDPFSESLLSLKSELVDNSNSLIDWSIPPNGTSSDNQISACSWSGVLCNQNSSAIIGLDLSLKNLSGKLSGKQFTALVDLVSLNISSNSFSGQLPAIIFNLTSLETLDISRNNFSGQFPSGVSNLQKLTVLDAFSNSFSGGLPADVSELPVLKILNFAGSYFSGPIPSEYGSFKNLNFIHLGGNFLSGNIPPELGKLTSLIHMEIGYNMYEGSIPWQLGNVSSLQYLDIAGANLSGQIPKQLGNLTSLTSLFLFRNQLTGNIPLEFSNLVRLESLDLSDNLLSGQIPENISGLKSLKLLSLMYNELSGDVPQSIAELPQLESLLLWSNFFTGVLPENLGSNSKLTYVDVSTNSFVGNIPPDICAGGMLTKLILFSNNLTGGLSPSLSNCSTIVRLRVEHNFLSGEISPVISNLVQATYVDLSGNRFTGGISSDIVKASQAIQFFNVSNNPDLGGFLPETLWLSMPLLQNFSASFCNLSGTIPPFELCKSVSIIELSMNNLYGNVSDSISNCTNLLSLDLSENKLSGQIPVQLASLPAIEFIDISHNSFTGPIPNQLGNSSTLKLLNVSFNDISGSIPLEKTFSNMDISAFIGNAKLCGAPLGPCQKANGVEVGSRRTKKFVWVLLTCTVIVLVITIAVFSVVYFKIRNNGQWKMISFNGLPEFTAEDVLKSLNSCGAKEVVPTAPHSIPKVVLPTGITLSVKKFEWEPKHINTMLESLHRMSNANQKNLIRLLGVCYNRHQAYLLYDYFANGSLAEKITVTGDWKAKSKIIVGIARGLCFLHHVCYPSIPHGDLKASNVLFDEFGEPHLSEYGLSSLLAIAPSETGESETWCKSQLQTDIHNFGKLIMEILTNGGVINAEMLLKGNSKEGFVSERFCKNDIGLSDSFQEEIKTAIEVASMCTSKPSERPSMQEVLKILSGSKPQWASPSPLHRR